jgi:hypothetical protein
VQLRSCESSHTCRLDRPAWTPPSKRYHIGCNRISECIRDPRCEEAANDHPNQGFFCQTELVPVIQKRATVLPARIVLNCHSAQTP